jgi:hypothetical protein
MRPDPCRSRRRVQASRIEARNGCMLHEFAPGKLLGTPSLRWFGDRPRLAAGPIEPYF